MCVCVCVCVCVCTDIQALLIACRREGEKERKREREGERGGGEDVGERGREGEKQLYILSCRVFSYFFQIAQVNLFRLTKLYQELQQKT